MGCKRRVAASAGPAALGVTVRAKPARK